MCFGNDSSSFRSPRREGQLDRAPRADRGLPRRQPEGARARPLRSGAWPGAGRAGTGDEAPARLRRARRGGRGSAGEGPPLLPPGGPRGGPAAGGRDASLRGLDAGPLRRPTAARVALPPPPRRRAAGDRLLGALVGAPGPAPQRARPAQPADLAGDGAGPRRAGEKAHRRRLRAGAAGRGSRHLRRPRRSLRRLVPAGGCAFAAGILRRPGREDPRLRPADPAHHPRDPGDLALPCPRDRARRGGSPRRHRHRPGGGGRRRDALAPTPRADRRPLHAVAGRYPLRGGAHRHPSRLLSRRALAHHRVPAAGRHLGARRPAGAGAAVGRSLVGAGGGVQRGAAEGRAGAAAGPALPARARRAAGAGAGAGAGAVRADAGRRRGGHGDRGGGLRPAAHRGAARGDPEPPRRGRRALAPGAPSRGAARARHRGGGCLPFLRTGGARAQAAARPEPHGADRAARRGPLLAARPRPPRRRRDQRGLRGPARPPRRLLRRGHLRTARAGAQGAAQAADLRFGRRGLPRPQGGRPGGPRGPRHRPLRRPHPPQRARVRRRLHPSAVRRQGQALPAGGAAPADPEVHGRRPREGQARLAQEPDLPEAQGAGQGGAAQDGGGAPRHLRRARRAPGLRLLAARRFYRAVRGRLRVRRDARPGRRAIDEVLARHAGAEPMDRLVCGDVGYGKTEVALRAAFKAVEDKKQVAVLVPTTVLAAAALPHRSASASRTTRSRSEMVSRFADDEGARGRAQRGRARARSTS